MSLTESFNELGEDPGVAFHEAPLPSIARHGPGHTPPRSTSGSGRPPHQLQSATDLGKPAAELVNPTSPRLLPDSLRAPSPAARQSAGGRSSHPGDSETLPRPCRTRSGFGRGRGLRRQGGDSARRGRPHPGSSPVGGGAKGEGRGSFPRSLTWRSPRRPWSWSS